MSTLSNARKARFYWLLWTFALCGVQYSVTTAPAFTFAAAALDRDLLPVCWQWPVTGMTASCQCQHRQAWGGCLLVQNPVPLRYWVSIHHPRSAPAPPFAPVSSRQAVTLPRCGSANDGHSRRSCWRPSQAGRLEALRPPPEALPVASEVHRLSDRQKGSLRVSCF